MFSSVSVVLNLLLCVPRVFCYLLSLLKFFVWCPVLFAQNLRVPWGSLLVARVACLFICPCFSNGFVLGAGAFSSKVIGELLAVSVKSLVTPSISVFLSPNVCLPLPWSTRSPLFWLYCGLFGIGLECTLLLTPSIAFSGCTAVFLALSWFCLSVRVFLLFAPLGRLCLLHCCFF